MVAAAITLRFDVHVLVTYSTAVWPQSACIWATIYIYLHTMHATSRRSINFKSKNSHKEDDSMCLLTLYLLRASELTYMYELRVRVANIHMYYIYSYHQFSSCILFFFVLLFQTSTSLTLNAYRTCVDWIRSCVAVYYICIHFALIDGA